MYYKIFEYSSLSEAEYVLIVGNYNNIEDDDEEQILRDRGYSEDKIKFILKDKKYSRFKSLDIIFEEKNQLKYPYFGYILTLFSNYKRGVLPFEGATAQQPSKIIEIFSVLEQLQLEAEKKMRTKLEKEAKKRG